MPRDPDRYDIFVSYAREDDRDGWIHRFVERLVAVQQPPLTYFLDDQEIRSMDDWRLRIHDSLAQSRVLLAFISPTYFTRPWCRREWKTWIDYAIAKHILSQGILPLIIVDVPGLTEGVDEHQIATTIAKLHALASPQDSFVAETAPILKQLRRRQFESLAADYQQGLPALDHPQLQPRLRTLAGQITSRAELIRRAAASPSHVRSYNRRFTGRLDELFALREQLQNDHAGVISAVHGLGGIGKTELALTFAHAFAADYPGGRYEIPCDHQTDLRLAVLRLGDLFRDRISDEQRMTIETYFSAILVCLRERIEEHGPVLLVLDNVTDLALLSAEQTDWLKLLGPQLHLLATTRETSGSASGANLHTLHELSESESVDLLEKFREFADEAEHQAARRIARRLGGFALAVELIGAWLEVKREVTYAGVLQRLGLENLEALDSLADDPDRRVELRRHNNERRLQAVLGPTLEKLTPEARRALEYAALLPPDHLLLPWLRTLLAGDFPALAAAPRPGYPDPWQEIERELFGYALFTRREQDDARLVRIHRLVQTLVRRDLSEEEMAVRQRSMFELVWDRDAALENTVRWQEARWELEPLDALANQWADANHENAAWLLNQISCEWHYLAEWQRAEPLIRRALAIAEQSYGAKHPEVAIRLNNLAQLFQATNRLAEAEPLMRRALAIDEQSYGAEHPNFARDLNSLAMLLQATNRLAESEPLMRRALAINEQSYGTEHPEVAIVLNNLALLLMDMNRLTEAEPLIRRALAIGEQSDGAMHSNVAIRLNNLAQLLQAMNRVTESEPLMRRALVIDEQFYGAEHPDVARDLNNLAWMLRETNRLAEGEPLARRALAIDERFYGAEHPLVAVRLNNMALLLQAMNRLAEAEPLMHRAMAILFKSTWHLNHEHPHLRAIAANFADLLKALGRSPAEIDAVLRAIKEE